MPAATTSLPTTAGQPATAAPNPPAGTLEACSLLSVDEVTAAYGDPVDTATKDSDIYYSYCKYTGGGGAQVKTWVTQDPTVIQGVFGTIKVNKGVAVPGLGDDAWWSEDSSTPGIYFLKGAALGYISGAASGPESAIVDLGKLMASRM